MTLLYIATLLILLISVVINIFFLWFAFNLTKQIRFYDDELRGIVSIVKNFTEHLNAVHELETSRAVEELEEVKTQEITSPKFMKTQLSNSITQQI